VDKVDAGSRHVNAAGKTMEEIVESVKKVSDLVAEIAAASQEQSAGIGQVNTAITQMDQVVQQNASLVEEATAATESMKQQASALLQKVSRFALGRERAMPATEHAAAPRKLDAVEPIRVRRDSRNPLPAAFTAALGAPLSAKGSPNGEWKAF
jgi:methyl-accepting chemotaxis protein